MINLKRPGVTPAVAILTMILPLAISACYTPVFDPAISEGAELAVRLGPASTTIGPFKLPYNSDNSYLFLPARLAGARTGALIEYNAQNHWLSLLLSDASGNPYELKVPVDIWLPAGSLRPFLAMSAAAATQPSVLFLDSQGLSRSTGSAGAASPVTTSLLAVSSPYKVVGAGVVQPAASQDLAYSLLLSDGTNWGASVGLLSTLPLGSPLSAPASMLLPPGLPAGGAFYAISTAGPFVYGEPAGKRAAVWDSPASSPRLVDLGAPLVGMLSDGHLIAQDDDYLSVLDLKGGVVMRTIAGNLRFVEEIASGGQELCILTRSLHLPSGTSSSLRIESWELPLVDFLGL